MPDPYKHDSPTNAIEINADMSGMGVRGSMEIRYNGRDR